MKYQQQYPEAKARHDEQMERWNHLYYCGRCDGTFLPGNSQFWSLR